MKITDVFVSSIQGHGKLLGIGNITLDGVIKLMGFKVMNGFNGEYVLYPDIKNKAGKRKDIIKIYDKNIQREIEDKILETYHNINQKPNPKTEDDYVDGDDLPPDN